MDKRKALRKAAEEMNKIMGLDPAIDTEAPVNQVYDEVLEASSMVEPDDEFSEEVWAVINNLGDFEPGKEEKKDRPEKKKSESKKDEVDLVGLIKSTKKLAGLKELVGKYDEFESLREDLDSFKGLDGLKNLKEEMIGLADGGHSEAQGKGKSTQNKASEKGAGKEKAGRTKTDHFVDMLKAGPVTMAEVKKASWNSSGGTFYNYFNKLVSEGKAKKEGKNMVWLDE